MGEVVIVGYVSVRRYKKKESQARTTTIEKEKSQLLVYPNPLPAGNLLTIQCEKMEYVSYSLQLFNTAGVQMYTEKVDYNKGMSRIQVQAPHLPTGNYFIKLTYEKRAVAIQSKL